MASIQYDLLQSTASLHLCRVNDYQILPMGFAYLCSLVQSIYGVGLQQKKADCGLRLHSLVHIVAHKLAWASAALTC